MKSCTGRSGGQVCKAIKRIHALMPLTTAFNVPELRLLRSALYQGWMNVTVILTYMRLQWRVRWYTLNFKEAKNSKFNGLNDAIMFDLIVKLAISLCSNWYYSLFWNQDVQKVWATLKNWRVQENHTRQIMPLRWKVKCCCIWILVCGRNDEMLKFSV